MFMLQAFILCLSSADITYRPEDPPSDFETSMCANMRSDLRMRRRIRRTYGFERHETRRPDEVLSYKTHWLSPDPPTYESSPTKMFVIPSEWQWQTATDLETLQEIGRHAGWTTHEDLLERQLDNSIRFQSRLSELVQMRVDIYITREERRQESRNLASLLFGCLTLPRRTAR
jgi:hypothetical protein